MKEKHFSYKLIILAIIIFSCLIIFNITSLALIPGDFGSAGGGPPDGCVDFEDLMIFALAYGSSPSDANWNAACDIAGLGSTTPDDVIDFEDLMIFAMHYGDCISQDSRIISLSGDTTFGDVYVGTTATTTLTISNSGNATLTVSGISYPTGFSGSWDGTIPAGGSQEVTVTFAPTAAQTYSGTLTVSCNATSGTNFKSIYGYGVTEIVRRRALLVGIGDYQYFPDTHENIDLPHPPYDVDRMHDILNHSSSGFSLINELINLHATKSAILNGIATAFSGADSDDVSYFYFAGLGINVSGISYLCPTDVSYSSLINSFISTNELESALSAIPGTKVVILDTFHSGGFIGKQIGEEEISTNPQEFNNNVINIFLSRDLTSSQYKVLTSCLSFQESVGLVPSEGYPYGLFSEILCEGCGYNYYTHPYFADENENGEITLHEAYTYTYETVNAIAAYLNDLYGWDIDQDTQVYPLYSDFVIIEE